MNGQYLMNKEISVQYAYKKDGKGERHGDQAERLLAAQARKHNVQPQAQPLPAGIFGSIQPMGAPPPGIPPPMAVNGGAAMPNGTFNPLPPPQQQRPPPSPVSLAAPTGLPARPPPSQAGYGGPQGFMPPGFNNHPQAFVPTQPPQATMPPGFGPPLGFPQQVGGPPAMPPGFQQGYVRR